MMVGAVESCLEVGRTKVEAFLQGKMQQGSCDTGE